MFTVPLTLLLPSFKNFTVNVTYSLPFANTSYNIYVANDFTNQRQYVAYFNYSNQIADSYLFTKAKSDYIRTE